MLQDYCENTGTYGYILPKYDHRPMRMLEGHIIFCLENCFVRRIRIQVNGNFGFVSSVKNTIFLAIRANVGLV